MLENRYDYKTKEKSGKIFGKKTKFTNLTKSPTNPFFIVPFSLCFLIKILRVLLQIKKFYF